VSVALQLEASAPEILHFLKIEYKWVMASDRVAALYCTAENEFIAESNPARP
jgi:hypothetical protein